MADITKDSFHTTNLHSKVIFQRGRHVMDFELNEAQDILRVFAYNQFWAGIQADNLNPGVVDGSWKCVQNTADTVNKVFINGLNATPKRIGYIFCDGIPLFLDSPGEEVGGFTTNAGASDRYDGLYLAVTEGEVADPAMVPAIGETTRRRKLSYSWAIVEDEDGAGVAPVNDALPIWEGGTHYFKIARILRPSGTADILTAHITDERFMLPTSLWSAIIHYHSGVIEGNWEFTVGDGATSFGDFNGEDGIKIAIDTLVGIGLTSFTIKVKHGSFTVGAVTGITVPPTVTDIRIIGTGAGTVLGVTGAGSTGIYLKGTPGTQKAVIEGINFNTTTGICLKSDGAEIILRNCTFTNEGVCITAGPSDRSTLIAENCVWNCISDAVHFRPSVAGTVGKFVFSECCFNMMANGTHPLRVSGVDMGAHIVVWQGASLTNCRLNLAGSVTAQPSGGMGAIKIWDIPTLKLLVGTLEWVNCFVQSNTLDDGGAEHSLLTIIDGDGQRDFSIEKVIIRGGKWLVTSRATSSPSSVTPLYIGPYNIFAGSGIDTVVIEDVTLGAEDDVGVWGRAPAPLSYEDVADWAAFTISATNVRVKNVALVGMPILGDCADMALAYTDSLEVDGLFHTYSAMNYPGSGSPPNYRISISPQGGDASKGVVSRLHLRGSNDSFLSLGGSVLLLGAAKYGGNLTLVDCILDTLGTGSQSGYRVRPNSSMSLTLMRCMGSHLGWLGLGFSYAYQVGDSVLKKLHIIDCEFSNSGIGIYIDSELGSVNMLPDLLIQGCQCCYNTSYGIQYTPGRWSNSESADIIPVARILGNYAVGNDLEAAKVQIRIGKTSAYYSGDQSIPIIVRNNDCMHSAPGSAPTAYGYIEVICKGTGLVTGLSTQTNINKMPHGLHTDLIISGGDIKKAQIHADPMVENAALLFTDQ